MSQLWWYVARSSGFVAWGLLAGSVLWGLALSTRVLGPRPRPSWLLDLHRFLGGLALVFVGVHLGALVLDSYLPFGPLELFVPLTSAYRPGAVAWGVVALYFLLAVELTSLLRRHLSPRLWRRTHIAALPLFAVSSLHGLQAGTDSANRIFQTAVVVAVAAAVGLTVLRLTMSMDRAPADRPAKISRATCRSGSIPFV